MKLNIEPQSLVLGAAAAGGLVWGVPRVRMWWAKRQHDAQVQAQLDKLEPDAAASSSTTALGALGRMTGASPELQRSMAEGLARLQQERDKAAAEGKNTHGVDVFLDTLNQPLQ